MKLKILSAAFFSVFACTESFFAFADTAIDFAAPGNSHVYWQFDPLGTPSASGPQNGDTAPQIEALADDSFRVTGISAGGNITLQVPSYQLWQILHPAVQHHRDVPEDTSNLAATFHLRYLKNGQVILDKDVTTAFTGRTIEAVASEQIGDLISPAYVMLWTQMLRTPIDARQVEITLTSVKDTASGISTLVTLPANTLDFTFHQDANPVHILARESMTPFDSTVRQFDILDPSPIRDGSDIQFIVGKASFGRPFSLSTWNPTLEDRLGRIPVCYDRLHPAHVQYANLNDVRIGDNELRYQIDDGVWHTIPVNLNTGIVVIPRVTGQKLAFQFLYEMTVDVTNGLHDINRCYQIGADFEWIPSQPGVSRVRLGDVVDSPNSSRGQAWNSCCIKSAGRFHLLKTKQRLA